MALSNRGVVALRSARSLCAAGCWRSLAGPAVAAGTRSGSGAASQRAVAATAACGALGGALWLGQPSRRDSCKVRCEADVGSLAAAAVGGAAAAGAFSWIYSKLTAPSYGNFKVCVAGGSGGIGQPLSLLMASNPHVAELSVYDLDIAMVPPGGVAADLSHLETKAKVKGYVKPKDAKAIDTLGECLKGCNLVIVPAGVPRKPGQTRDDLLKINAGIAKDVVEACATHCPDAIVALIVNPVNSVVPAMAELYAKKGLDPRKIVGVTTLDVVRANKFVGEITGANPAEIDVPVIGGHAGVTIMPVFSQDRSAKTIPASQIPDLDKHVQNAGTDVVNAKNGKGSATLSMAYAGARLGGAVLSGLAGQPTTECAYVLSDVRPEVKYFTSKVTFGRGGVEKVHPIGSLNSYEEGRLQEALKALSGEIQSGVDYAKENSLA